MSDPDGMDGRSEDGSTRMHAFGSAELRWSAPARSPTGGWPRLSGANPPDPTAPGVANGGNLAQIVQPSH